jgi:hypothetical protein
MAAEMREGDDVVADAAALFIQVDREHFLQGADQLPW